MTSSLTSNTLNQDEASHLIRTIADYRDKDAPKDQKKKAWAIYDRLVKCTKNNSRYDHKAATVASNLAHLKERFKQRKLKALSDSPVTLVDLARNTDLEKLGAKVHYLASGAFGSVSKIDYQGKVFAKKVGEGLDTDYAVGSRINKHPNFMKVFAHCRDPEAKAGSTTMYMEYIPGTTLKEHKVPDIGWETEFVSFLKGTCSALTHLLKKDIIPQDLHTNNMMVDDEGKLRFIDYGYYIPVKGELFPEEYNRFARVAYTAFARICEKYEFCYFRNGETASKSFYYACTSLEKKAKACFNKEQLKEFIADMKNFTETLEIKSKLEKSRYSLHSFSCSPFGRFN
ncbi:MAG: hypothetical protein GWP59_08195 [Chlamydiales bacterium]|nr:AarF/UbiB family protein [Chlamydiales bacterium]NCF71665.1 hypothetical protein [Chlamydiales bacterium]